MVILVCPIIVWISDALGAEKKPLTTSYSNYIAEKKRMILIITLLGPFHVQHVVTLHLSLSYLYIHEH